MTEQDQAQVEAMFSKLIDVVENTAQLIHQDIVVTISPNGIMALIGNEHLAGIAKMPNN